MTEISAETRVELEKRYRTAAFLIFAQIASLLILVVLAFVLVKPENGGQTSDSTRWMLWVAALFAALSSFIIRRMLYRWDRLRDLSLLQGISALIKTLSVNSIILASMAEIVALVGFVISILTGDAFEMVRAAVIALVVFIINFPRKSIWEKIVKNLENV
ncbi:MAG: hypothetical protein LUM44_14530 [Pyrinomonadaceae bacterium]|nr:hypothetical protein [Pyrinomonadaceae bacterium]